METMEDVNKGSRVFFSLFELFCDLAMNIRLLLAYKWGLKSFLDHIYKPKKGEFFWRGCKDLQREKIKVVIRFHVLIVSLNIALSLISKQYPDRFHRLSRLRMGSIEAIIRKDLWCDAGRFGRLMGSNINKTNRRLFQYNRPPKSTRSRRSGQVVAILRLHEKLGLCCVKLDYSGPAPFKSRYKKRKTSLFPKLSSSS